MEFHRRRRQQFMGESHYLAELAMWDEVIPGQRDNLLKPEGSERGWHCSLYRGIADGLFIKLLLNHTAGQNIERARADLEPVVVAFEEYGGFMWRYVGDRNEPVFTFTSLDDYCQLMQLIGLCYLLYRRDLLPRIAALQDGEGGTSNGGTDTLYEEFMIHAMGAEARFACNYCCHVRPYENLFYGLTEDTPAKALKEIDLYLKHWYKDLAGTGWHDSHKPNEAGQQGGYYGYWSFEAGAAVLLMGIEDDTSLHKYLYYPKDMVAWARSHSALSDAGDRKTIRLRAMAGDPCPRAGFWLTPARANSRRLFSQGELMPDTGGDYGASIWQWDEQQ